MKLLDKLSGVKYKSTTVYIIEVSTQRWSFRGKYKSQNRKDEQYSSLLNQINHGQGMLVEFEQWRINRDHIEYIQAYSEVVKEILKK